MQKDAAELPLNDQVDRFEQLARSQPKEALASGHRLLSLLPALSADRSTVLRAMAGAARAAASIDESLLLAQLAVEAATEAVDTDTDGLADAVTEAKIVLAGSQWLGGEPEAALATLDSAVPASGSVAAKLDFQRASVMISSGRYLPAIDAATDAMGVFDAAGDEAMVAHCLANRGYARSQVGALAEARADLDEAISLYRRLNIWAREAYATHNLGIVEYRSGNIPKALELFHRGEEVLAELTESPLEVQASRCHALLSAGLLEEAAALADRISSEMARLGLEVDQAEASLTGAQARLMLGDASGAMTRAEQAVALFDGQGRRAWAARAGVVSLRARHEGGDRDGSPVEACTAAALADELTALGLGVAAADARLLAARCWRLAGDLDTATDVLGALRAADLPIELRLQERLETARVQQARGDGRAALRTIGDGLKALHRHRAELAASELRAAVGRHAADLSELGLGLVLDGGRSRSVLAWFERTRDTSLGLFDVQPPDDPALADALNDLRRVDQDLRRTSSDDGELGRRHRKLRSTVAALSRQRQVTATASVSPTFDVADLVANVGDRTLIEFGMAGDRLAGVVVSKGRVRRLADHDAAEVAAVCVELGGALRRAMVGRRPEPAMRAATASADQLDAIFGLDEILGADPHGRRAGGVRDDVVIVPPASLFGVPWGALPSLRDRAVSVVPSSALWLASLRSHGATPPSTGSVLLAAGPDLANADHELEAIGASWPDALVLRGPSARAAVVRDSLGSARLAHLVCHGTFSAENAMFSSLRFADGDLSVHELDAVRSRNERSVSDTIVLSSCEAGVVAANAGRELLGIATALLRRGTRSLIAPIAVVPDGAGTVELMAALHQRLAAGDSPSVALAAVRADLGDVDPVKVATGLAFQCFGDAGVSTTGVSSGGEAGSGRS